MAEEFARTNAGEVAKRLDAALSRAPGAVIRAMTEALKADGKRWRAAMEGSINGLLYLGRGKPRTSALASRRGAAGLKGSFFFSVRGGNLGDLELKKFSTGEAALMHERGGTVTPKKGNWLAIPLPPAMTPKGVPRQPGPRSYPDLFFFQPKAGSQYAFLVRQVTNGGAPVRDGFDEDGAPKFKKPKTQLQFMFLLAKSVTIPPRLGMQKTHRQQEGDRLADIGRLLVKFLSGLDGGAGGAVPAGAPA